MQPIYKHSFTLSDLHVDCFGRLKPSTILFFAQEAAGLHCQLLRLDWESLSQKNLFWAVIRHRVQITRLPLRGETITVETWPMPTTKVAYPRSVIAYDQQGSELFRAISIWVLMDMNSRGMILPGKSGVLVEGTLRGTELAAPKSLHPCLLQNACSRIVDYTLLDRNGHMNNTRYLDWIDSLLPSAFHEGHPLREMTICYHSEALEGQHIDLSWNLSDGPILQVDAHRTTTDVTPSQERVFSAKLEY